MSSFLAGSTILAGASGECGTPWKPRYNSQDPPRHFPISLQSVTVAPIWLVTFALYQYVRWLYVSIPQKLVALSPRASYTDWATATCRRNLVPTFADRGVSRGQQGRSPTVVNLSFLTGAATFLSSCSSFILTRLSGPRSKSTVTHTIW
jgi:hypothetical protein